MHIFSFTFADRRQCFMIPGSMTFYCSQRRPQSRSISGKWSERELLASSWFCGQPVVNFSFSTHRLNVQVFTFNQQSQWGGHSKADWGWRKWGKGRKKKKFNNFHQFQHALLCKDSAGWWHVGLSACRLVCRRPRLVNSCWKYLAVLMLAIFWWLRR